MATEKAMATEKEETKSHAQSAREQMMSSPTIRRLVEAAEAGEDIGHYGELTLAIVGRYFMSDADLVDLLSRCVEMDRKKAAGLVHQVKEGDYSPPRRETLVHWSSEQQFNLINVKDPDSGNLYRELTFPDQVYEHIRHYHEDKAS